MNINGLIKSVEAEQKVSDKFTKREFIIEVDHKTNYPQTISMELVNDKCDIIDEHKVGDEVNVAFNLRGRAVTTKDGKTKNYNTIQAWKIDKI